MVLLSLPKVSAMALSLFSCLLLTTTIHFTCARNVSQILPKSCGMAAQARIVGGFEAQQQQWPWLVSLRFAWGQHFCGGFLITESHVVTAAHCVHYFTDFPQHLRVAAGSHKVQDQAVLSKIKTITVHPDFGNTTVFDSDLAVLELTSPLSFNLAVFPVCLPMQNASVGEQVVAVGWGKVSEDAPSFSPILQHVEIRVLDLDQCSSYEDLLIENMLCAGVDDGGHDSCLGDSGGPLLAERPDGTWQAVGIISFGRGCGNPVFPGVYTNLHKFLDWLIDVIEDQ